MYPEISHLASAIFAACKKAIETGFKNSKTLFLKKSVGKYIFDFLFSATTGFNSEAARKSEAIREHRSLCARARI